MRISSITYDVPPLRFTGALIVREVSLAIAVISYHVVTAVGSVVPNPILAPTAIRSVVNCVLDPVMVVEEPLVETVPDVCSYTIPRIERTFLFPDTVVPDSVMNPLNVRVDVLELNSVRATVLVAAAVALEAVNTQ
jgi:hypothetical protein